jgi:hypothetical protein
VAYEKTGIKFSPRKHILSDTCALQLFKDPAAITNYPYFKGLYTSSVKKDSSSYIVSTWEDVSSSKISYRKYFLKNGEWSFPSTGGDKRFRLESIYSNTSGDVMAVLSRPSPDLPDSLFCISSVMYSLINTILPEGFEFRIIGKDGMVWFHSDQKKNNRENFLEECSYNSEIREAIHNRVSALVPLQLSPKNYRSYISPIGTIPLYLVTLSDTREQNEFLSHVNYMILIFVLIGIFCALVSTVIFYYEQLGIAFNGRMANDPEPGLIWLLPDLRKNERYMILTRLNLLLVLLILIPAFFLRITELHYLFILISLYSIFFMYCYSLLKTFKKKTFKPSIIFTFSVILVCCNIVYIKFLPREYLFFILELVALVVVSVVLYRILRHQHFSREDFEETDFVNMKVKYFSFSDEPYLPYVLFIYSWIMIAAILPTLLLFKISGREEVELITRKNQLEVASRIDRKNFQIDSFYIEHIYPRDEKNNPCFPGTSTKNLDRIKENLKLKGNYTINQYSQVNANVEMSPKYHSDNPDRDYIILTRKLREMFGADDIRSFEMLYGIGSDTAWFWTGGHLNGARSDSLHFFYTATKRKADRSYAKYQVKLSSDMANQKTNPRSFGFMLHFSELLVILLFMVLLFFMLRRVIRKLFILEVPYIPNVMQKGDVLEKTDRLFIVNSLHQASVKELLNEPFSILESDKSGNWVISENNLVILNAIPENLRHWLQLFNGMNSLRESKGQVIILSCYSPGQITEMADESIQAIPKDRIRNSLLRVKNKFLHLLSEFTVCYYVDVQGLNLPDLAGCAKAMEPRHSREILAFLQSELKFVGYQGGMENRLKNIICKETELKNLRPEFFNLFATRYQFIWERLTINEKFILIDLAVDSVVNTRNRADINNLVGKGILDMKGRLDFASSGFKQFVLDLSATDVFQALQKNIKRADGWNKIKVPLYIIFGAVVIFFFFTLQDVVTGIFGTILSLGGFFTALWKLGLFDKAAPSGK